MRTSHPRRGLWPDRPEPVEGPRRRQPQRLPGRGGAGAAGEAERSGL